jgi:integrase/recombinase XerD
MLKQAVEMYLDVRRTAGFRLDTVGRYLHDFARFAAEQGNTHVVAQTAIAWAAQSCSEPQRATRLNTVIGFARFSHAEDPRHEIPPEKVFDRQRHRPLPYIFTEAEIHALVSQAAQLGPSGSLRPDTYRTLLGLLAVTGLRISEALALRLEDVTSDGLVIRETKFRKSRLVPLHDTTVVALMRYLNKRGHVASTDDHLFISQRHQRLSPTVVYQTFYHLLAKAGIPAVPGRRRPRLIDLRHTFATRALETCPDGRDQVRQHMLALTTYMGHAQVESTYWYLERTPELMCDIAQACEALIEEGLS